jgi:hypothetical protein
MRADLTGNNIFGIATSLDLSKITNSLQNLQKLNQLLDGEK